MSGTANNVTLLSRNFLYEDEGLASVESIIDDPRGKVSDEELKVYMDAGSVTIGALMVLLTQDNRMALTINDRNDLEALKRIAEATNKLVEEAEALFDEIDARTAEDSNVVSFPQEESIN